ncbi:hypothetical protein NDU88_006892 [Pleurodeles waltl]|uniref:Uncharacterized protein n=1 Tax=Pleurodeles waltl TaxID=8319 RepID=A0AAV7VP35_PLEWA|nr:hypothetical protein NDU88_006892 [Pleurodeles waltl]
MDPGVEQALLLLRRAGRMDLVNQEALRALRPAWRAAQGVAGAVLACSPPTSPTGEGQRERSVGVQPGEPGAAQLPWREEQAEPSTASRCTSTVGRRRKEWAADAPEVWCGGAGFAPGGAAILVEQRPGPSYVQHGKDRRQRGEEPRGAWLPQDTGVGFQGLQAEEWELDFEEESLEEGELVDDREEERWWAQGGAGPANALSKSLQKSRTVQSVEEKVVEGAHIGRRKAQGRPPSLSAGERSSGGSKVSVAVGTGGGAGIGGGATG